MESGTDKIPMEVPKTEDQPKKNFLDIVCPYCGSEKNVKRGVCQKKLEKRMEDKTNRKR